MVYIDIIYSGKAVIAKPEKTAKGKDYTVGRKRRRYRAKVSRSGTEWTWISKTTRKNPTNSRLFSLFFMR